jgi:hypothetical protein
MLPKKEIIGAEVCFRLMREAKPNWPAAEDQND